MIIERSHKIDLTDVTFTIPVRIDSEERLENIDLTLTYLLSKFDTNIIILEDDVEQKIEFHRTHERVKYIFNKNDSQIFHRTRLLNQLYSESKTPIIVNYDCDVLLREEQYVISAELIRSKFCDIAFPYKGECYDVPRYYIPQIINDLSVEKIDLKDCYLMNDQAIGGVVFFNKYSYIKGGMENENFISYGPDDVERVIRFTRLGFLLKRVVGVLYHLRHPRGINACRQNPFWEHNINELRKIVTMSQNELQKYMHSWDWLH